VGVFLAPGALIAGRYRLDRLLGQGGMGVVWAATHMVTRRSVAMKFVRGPAHARAELRRRLLQEARAASAVAHPNVVAVLDAFELDADTPVMVMELLIGETLAQRVAREETLSLGDVAALLVPALSAVGAAHARGVVHRDLKPDNIFLAKGARGAVVRVLDFGVAKLTEPLGTPREPGAATHTGSTLGTPCYMAEDSPSKGDSFGRVDAERREGCRGTGRPDVRTAETGGRDAPEAHVGSTPAARRQLWRGGHGSRRFEARAPRPRDRRWLGRQSEMLEDGDDDIALLDVGDDAAATAARTGQNVLEVDATQ
jgi:serine/threonine protein kinase